VSSLVDIMIVFVLLGCLVHGFRRGFVGSAGSIAGLVAGAVAAWFVAPQVGALVPDPAARIAVTLVVALVLLLIGTGLGRRVGAAVGRPLRRSPLGPVDRGLGAVVQVVVGALVVSVLASLAVSLGGPEVARPVAESVVAQRIEALTPAPVTQAVDGIRATVVATAIGAAGDVAAAAPTPR
jgi:uncharacterized membrane protein required for colicin V production